ncbi:MAG: ArsR/SmtB family transcription factor [Acidimicrobiia bacterium]
MKKIDTISACCAPLMEAPLSKREAEELADIFKILSDPARLRLVSYIAAHPGNDCCVCDLIAPVGLSQPTVSHHLKVLHEAGILEREKDGIWVHYRLPDRIRKLSPALTKK